jgi:O-antigen ligase
MTSATTTVTPLLLAHERTKDEGRSLAISMARFLLVLILLTAPLAFGAVQPLVWGALFVAAVFLISLWGLAQVQQGRARVLWSPIYVPVALFLFLGLAQFLGGLTLDSYATREVILKLIADLILFFVSLHILVSASRTWWRKFGLAITLYAFALAIFAILQFFSSGGLIYWVVKTASGCTFGPYVNHNHYAGLMEMLIPISAGYVLSRPEGQRGQSLFGFAVLVAIASVLLSGSRGGLISLCAESVILAAILFRYSPVARRRPFAAMVPLGVVAAAVLFFWMDPGHISKRLATIANIPYKPEVTLAERMFVSQDSMHIFADYPWLGTGLGSFEVIYPRYQSFATDLMWDHAHNDYAEVLAETGIVGAALILVALGLFFRLAFRDLRQRLQHEVGWIHLGATLGCCGLLVHSFGDFNFHIPANAAWFAVCAAIASQSKAVARTTDILSS